MKSSKKQRPQILGTKAEQLVVSLLNCKLPGDEKATDDSLTRLRSQTERYWPDLWGWPNEPKQLSEDRAFGIISEIRWYLREFWKTADPHDRDWYIHRAREYHHRHLIQPKTREYRDAFNAASTAEETRSTIDDLNRAIEQSLDQPPSRTPFEESLFHLQRIADKARYCPNPDCEDPYFIVTKKGQKYCSTACAKPAQRDSKRKWWHANRAAQKGK